MEKASGKSEIYGAVQAPSSKSYAQRAVAASLLSEGRTTLLNMELCSDTQAALAVATSLGAEYEKEGDSTYHIKGAWKNGRLNAIANNINIGESGLSTRMFTPIASLCGIPVTITGHGSIMNRPVDMMTVPLKNLGVDIRSNDGYLPLVVRGPICGGQTDVDGSVSSQFITGLLMSLPLAKTDTTLYVSRPTSIPYLDMTIDLLKNFGVTVGHNDYKEFFIEGNQIYQAHTYNVEGDWSGASCLLVAGAVAGEITIRNLNPLSMQADLAIIDALSYAGAEITTTVDSVTVRKRELKGFDFDASHCPDLFPALAALAANCEGETIIKGTGRLIHKESNRAQTIQQEFEKLGIDVDISTDDIMKITGGKITGADVSSHNDHRIAMCVAVAALNADGNVTVHDAEAVNKSYPDFWKDLQSVMTNKY